MRIETVYEYGVSAGKTIMAGLLACDFKLYNSAERFPVVRPINPTFQSSLAYGHTGEQRYRGFGAGIPGFRNDGRGQSRAYRSDLTADILFRRHEERA